MGTTTPPHRVDHVEERVRTHRDLEPVDAADEHTAIDGAPHGVDGTPTGPTGPVAQPGPPTLPTRPVARPSASALWSARAAAGSSRFHAVPAGPEPADTDRVARSLPLDLRAGTMVGEYEITGKLGQGGMGVVYSATHPVIGKKAAVKVLRKNLCADLEAVERFIQEARAVNQIGHPNIVDIFAFGTLPDERSYLIMELLAGESLQARLRRAPLDRDELCHYADAIARALEAAHDRKIIHRDLKPENVFLHEVRGERPIAKLLDFGIAKLADTEDQRMERTRTGAMMGTPMYISPEQARGYAIDYRADIYSLGVMLFEMVAGRPPFSADNAMDMVAKQLYEPAPRLSTVVPDVPPVLDDLIAGMLDKDAARRPSLATARKVLDEVRRMSVDGLHYTVPDLPRFPSAPDGALADGARVAAVPVGRPRVRTPGRSMKTASVAVRRRGPRPVVVALAALVALVGGTIAFVVVRSMRGDPPPASSAPPPAPAIRAPAATPGPAMSSPPPAAPAATLAPVTIRVHGPARAALIVDDTAHGEAASWDLELAPGRHRVELRARRFATWEQSVEVTAGAPVVIDAALDPVRRRPSDVAPTTNNTGAAAPPGPPPDPNPDDDALLAPRKKTP